MNNGLHIPRLAALYAIAALVAAASLVSFAESYRGLWLWAHAHGLAGLWAAVWPIQVDVFIAIGELALFVALADRWVPRSRYAAWAVTGLGLAVSVAGNVGHVAGHSLASQATAAVPPLAAAASLAVGLGVLKRVVEARQAAGEAAGGRGDDAFSSWPPADAESAALAALRATLAAGNALSQNQLMERFRLTRTAATRVRQQADAESNGHAAESNGHTAAAP